ncbi:MAG: hypothetical protein M1481_05080 [Candidatus Thermoplasmatota archaeon]|jgi:succinate dehydrogenase flavin-adding protein (antitoxin of CptAB toxin-antitoxin module)|nr:hypothetical protein [Candidatus Thermoplasmatota archaeon]MCL5963580.1 hypothetical protein [Candidatus Thermoplasmatota archaeon]
MSKKKVKKSKSVDISLTKNSTVTVPLLAVAIKNSINNKNMMDVGAFETAYHIMNFFGFDDRILDNILEPEDRDLFYMLEDHGILLTEREETTLYDGREWRIHYWVFKKERIEDLIKSNKMVTEPDEIENLRSVYEDISEELWLQQNIITNGNKEEL